MSLRPPFNSKITELASTLMDQICPRLTGSPNMREANDWTRAKLEDLGMSNAYLEACSSFGVGRVNEYTRVQTTGGNVAASCPIIMYINV